MAVNALEFQKYADGVEIDYTPSGDLAAGVPTEIGGIVGVPNEPIADGIKGSLCISGVFRCLKVTGALAVGDQVGWDANGTPVGGSTTGAVTGTEADWDFEVGVVVEAAASAVTQVMVLINRWANTDLLSGGLRNVIADPGDAGAIAVTQSGSVQLVTEGAETRTLAIPTFAGQMLSIGLKTDGGDAVLTVASALNQTGNNTVTFADAGDHQLLVAIEVGAALAWREVCNDGAGLTTV